MAALPWLMFEWLCANLTNPQRARSEDFFHHWLRMGIHHEGSLNLDLNLSKKPLIVWYRTWAWPVPLMCMFRIDAATRLSSSGSSKFLGKFIKSGIAKMVCTTPLLWVWIYSWAYNRNLSDFHLPVIIMRQAGWPDSINAIVAPDLMEWLPIDVDLSPSVWKPIDDDMTHSLDKIIKLVASRVWRCLSMKILIVDVSQNVHAVYFWIVLMIWVIALQGQTLGWFVCHAVKIALPHSSSFGKLPLQCLQDG